MTLQFDDNGTAYQLFPAKRNKPDTKLIVLIHGMGLNRHLWQWHVGALQQYFHVLSYDLYGHGDSPPSNNPINLSLLANQLNDLLEHLGVEKAILIGFSIGGMINRRFVLDFPDKVQALVVLNSPHQRPAEMQKRVEEQAHKTFEQGRAATLEAALERWFTESFRHRNPELMQLIRTWRHSCDADNYPHFVLLLAQGVTELIAPKPAITVPSLVMTCQHDAGSTPAMSQAITAEIIGARLAIIPELQHLGLIERPELFTGLILPFLYKILEFENE